MVNPPLKSKLCLSSLLRWRISSCIWDLESPALTRLRTWSMVLFLRAMVLLQALEVGVVALKTLTKVSGCGTVEICNIMYSCSAYVPFQKWVVGWIWCFRLDYWRASFE